MLVAIYLRILYRNSYWIPHISYCEGWGQNWIRNLPLCTLWCQLIIWTLSDTRSRRYCVHWLHCQQVLPICFTPKSCRCLTVPVRNEIFSWFHDGIKECHRGQPVGFCPRSRHGLWTTDTLKVKMYFYYLHYFPVIRTSTYRDCGSDSKAYVIRWFNRSCNSSSYTESVIWTPLCHGACRTM
jgi:hypothetical protein